MMFRQSIKETEIPRLDWNGLAFNFIFFVLK